MPDMWMRVPFIALSNPELAAYYDLTDGECAYIQVFDSNGNYKLQEKLEEAYLGIVMEVLHSYSKYVYTKIKRIGGRLLAYDSMELD